MLGCPGHFAVLLDELRARDLADRALFGRFGPLMNIAAYRTYPLHNDYLHQLNLLFPVSDWMNYNIIRQEKQGRKKLTLARISI
jgi:hypothetical protein